MPASRDKDERANPNRPGSGTRPRVTVDPPADFQSLAQAQDVAEILRQLDEATLWLARVPAGPLHRELKLTLERYRRAAADWERTPPSLVKRRLLVQGVRSLRSAIARSVVDT